MIEVIEAFTDVVSGKITTRLRVVARGNINLAKNYMSSRYIFRRRDEGSNVVLTAMTKKTKLAILKLMLAPRKNVYIKLDKLIG